MFRRRDKDHQSKDPSPAPADVYLGLRSQILTLDPNKVGLGGQSGARRIMGCLMETGVSERNRDPGVPGRRNHEPLHQLRLRNHRRP